MDKPFKTIDEQVAILRSRGLATDERTAGILEREGYYSVVNGYKGPFLDRGAMAENASDVYLPGARFSDLYRLFLFDRALRLTMFGYFAMAEATLKTTCAYVAASRHADEREFYLKRESYRPEPRYDARVSAFIDDLEKITHKGRHANRPFKREYIRHYVMNHDEVPLWVVTNQMMLGQAFKLFDYQDESSRNEIAKTFSRLYAETHASPKAVSPRRLRLAYDHIKDFRNICAHDERLYCARAAPSRDVTFAAMLDDLELVLTRDAWSRMLREVMGLLMGLTNDIDAGCARQVVAGMGIEDIGRAFMPIASAGMRGAGTGAR